MTTTFDFTVKPTNQSIYDKFLLEYLKLNDEQQLAIEILHNPNYYNKVKQIDYTITINTILIMMRIGKIDYKNLPHKYRINHKIIDNLIYILSNNKYVTEMLYDDWIFETNYIPIILIYNKDFIIRLLQLKECGIFYAYKENFPNSFLLNDFDINKNALNNYCTDFHCGQYKIINEINQTFRPELINYMLNLFPSSIIDLHQQEISNEIISMCLTNNLNLHKSIQFKYKLPIKYKTIEYISYLFNNNVSLHNIFIPIELSNRDIYLEAVKTDGLNLQYVPLEYIDDELINIAIKNNLLANLIVPITHITTQIDSIINIYNSNEIKQKGLYEKLYKRLNYFSEQNQNIILHRLNNTIRDREYILKYLKFNGIYSKLSNISSLYINDNEILYLLPINDLINNKVYNNASYISYLLNKNDYKKIKELLVFMYKHNIKSINSDIDLIYNILSSYNDLIIYFDQKYWDCILLKKYNIYKIKNSKNFLYLLLYLKDKSSDVSFIINNVISYLVNDYKITF
jgi:hypothetical protein